MSSVIRDILYYKMSKFSCYDNIRAMVISYFLFKTSFKQERQIVARYGDSILRHLFDRHIKRNTNLISHTFIYLNPPKCPNFLIIPPPLFFGSRGQFSPLFFNSRINRCNVKIGNHSKADCQVC